MANNMLPDDEEKTELNGSADETLQTARDTANSAVAEQTETPADTVPAPAPKPTYTTDEIMGRIKSGEDYTQDQLNAMSDEEYANYSRVTDEYYKAHPTRKMQQQKLSDRLELSDELEKKAQFVVDHTDGDKDFAKDHDEMAYCADFLKNHKKEFADFSDENVEVIKSDIEKKYKEASQRRNVFEKFWDSLVRGHNDNEAMLYKGWMALGLPGSGDMDMERAKALDRQTELDNIDNPRAVASISDIKSFPDAVIFGIESGAENAERILATAAAATVGGYLAAPAGAATLGSIAAGTAGGLLLNTGEAVGDQMEDMELDRDMQFNRAFAIGQGVGYGLAESSIGVVPFLGKMWRGSLKIAGKELGKKGAVSVAKDVFSKGTLKGALKGVAAETAGETIEEPFQSGVIGRGRRWIQTGSPLQKGETTEDAWMMALDEAAGGAAASLMFGGIGGGVSYANNKSRIKDADKRMSVLKNEKSWKQMSPMARYLVQLKMDADGMLTSNYQISKDERAELQSRSDEIADYFDNESKSGNEGRAAVAKQAKQYLDLVSNDYAKMPMDSAVALADEMGIQSGVNNDGWIQTGRKPLADGSVADMFEHGPTHIQMAHRVGTDGKDGGWIVLNRQDRKMPMEPTTFATQDEAVKYANKLDRYNQVRDAKDAAKKKVIEAVYHNMFGHRAPSLYFVDRALDSGVAPAAYSPSKNIVTVNTDKVENLGQLYTLFGHERYHVDNAELILGHAIAPTGATEDELRAIEEGRVRLYGGDNVVGAKKAWNDRAFDISGKRTEEEGVARSGEELLAERRSVDELCREIRNSNRTAPGKLARFVMRKIGIKMASDMGVAPDLITDKDVRQEVDKLWKGSYLGLRAENVKATDSISAERGTTMEDHLSDTYGSAPKPAVDDEVTPPDGAQNPTDDASATVDDATKSAFDDHDAQIVEHGYTYVDEKIADAYAKAHPEYTVGKPNRGMVLFSSPQSKPVATESPKQEIHVGKKFNATISKDGKSVVIQNAEAESADALKSQLESAGYSVDSIEEAQNVAEETAKPSETPAPTETKNEPSEAPSEYKADPERDNKKVVGTDYTVGKAKELLREDVNAKLADASKELGVEIKLKNLEIHGSRVRGDAKEDSDLDVVFEYDGDVREDTLFEIVNESPTDFFGIKVDFNPIRADKSGTLAEYMQKSAEYDSEKIAKPVAAEPVKAESAPTFEAKPTKVENEGQKTADRDELLDTPVGELNTAQKAFIEKRVSAIKKRKGVSGVEVKYSKDGKKIVIVATRDNGQEDRTEIDLSEADTKQSRINNALQEVNDEFGTDDDFLLSEESFGAKESVPLFAGGKTVKPGDRFTKEQVENNLSSDEVRVVKDEQDNNLGAANWVVDRISDNGRLIVVKRGKTDKEIEADKIPNRLHTAKGGLKKSIMASDFIAYARETLGDGRHTVASLKKAIEDFTKAEKSIVDGVTYRKSGLKEEFDKLISDANIRVQNIILANREATGERAKNRSFVANGEMPLDEERKMFTWWSKNDPFARDKMIGQFVGKDGSFKGIIGMPAVTWRKGADLKPYVYWKTSTELENFPASDLFSVSLDKYNSPTYSVKNDATARHMARFLFGTTPSGALDMLNDVLSGHSKAAHTDNLFVEQIADGLGYSDDARRDFDNYTVIDKIYEEYNQIVEDWSAHKAGMPTKAEGEEEAYAQYKEEKAKLAAKENVAVDSGPWETDPFDPNAAEGTYDVINEYDLQNAREEVAELGIELDDSEMEFKTPMEKVEFLERVYGDSGLSAIMFKTDVSREEEKKRVRELGKRIHGGTEGDPEAYGELYRLYRLGFSTKGGIPNWLRTKGVPDGSVEHLSDAVWERFARYVGSGRENLDKISPETIIGNCVRHVVDDYNRNGESLGEKGWSKNQTTLDEAIEDDEGDSISQLDAISAEDVDLLPSNFLSSKNRKQAIDDLNAMREEMSEDRSLVLGSVMAAIPRAEMMLRTREINKTKKGEEPRRIRKDALRNMTIRIAAQIAEKPIGVFEHEFSELKKEMVRYFGHGTGNYQTKPRGDATPIRVEGADVSYTTSEIVDMMHDKADEMVSLGHENRGKFYRDMALAVELAEDGATNEEIGRQIKKDANYVRTLFSKAGELYGLYYNVRENPSQQKMGIDVEQNASSREIADYAKDRVKSGLSDDAAARAVMSKFGIGELAAKNEVSKARHSMTRKRVAPSAVQTDMFAGNATVEKPVEKLGYWAQYHAIAKAVAGGKSDDAIVAMRGDGWTMDGDAIRRTAEKIREGNRNRAERAVKKAQDKALAAEEKKRKQNESDAKVVHYDKEVVPMMPVNVGKGMSVPKEWSGSKERELAYRLVSNAVRQGGNRTATIDNVSTRSGVTRDEVSRLYDSLSRDSRGKYATEIYAMAAGGLSDDDIVKAATKKHGISESLARREIATARTQLKNKENGEKRDEENAKKIEDKLRAGSIGVDPDMVYSASEEKQREEKKYWADEKIRSEDRTVDVLMEHFKGDFRKVMDALSNRGYSDKKIGEMMGRHAVRSGGFKAVGELAGDAIGAGKGRANFLGSLGLAETDAKKAEHKYADKVMDDANGDVALAMHKMRADGYTQAKTETMLREWGKRHMKPVNLSAVKEAEKAKKEDKATFDDLFGDMMKKTEASASDLDYVLGTRESFEAQGIAQPKNVVRLSKKDIELDRIADARIKDQTYREELVNRAYNQEPMNDEEVRSLFLVVRDQLAGLVEQRRGMNAQNGRLMAETEENAMKALERVALAYQRSTSQAGAALRQAQRGASLDAIRDLNVYMLIEAKARMAKLGIEGDVPQGAKDMIEKQAKELAKKNGEISEANRRIAELIAKADKISAELAIEKARGGKATPFRMSAETAKKFGEMYGITFDDEAIDAVEALAREYGLASVESMNKSGDGSSNASKLNETRRQAFAALVTKANGNFDSVAAFIDKTMGKDVASDFAEFRSEIEKPTLVLTSETARENEKKRRIKTHRDKFAKRTRGKGTGPTQTTLAGMTERLGVERKNAKEAQNDYAGNPRERDLALGRYLRRFMEVTVAEHPELTNDEVIVKCGEEAAKIAPDSDFTEQDIARILYGDSGFDPATREAVDKRLTILKKALALARSGKFNEAAKLAGLSVRSEAQMLQDMENRLLAELERMNREMDEIVAHPLPDEKEQTERIKHLQEQIKENCEILRGMRDSRKADEKRDFYLSVLERRDKRMRDAIALAKGQIKMLDALSPDAERARMRIARLKADHELLSKEMRDIRRDVNLMRSLQRQIDEFQRRIDEKDFEEKPKKVKPRINDYSEAVQKKMRERDAMRRRFKGQRDAYQYRKMSKFVSFGNQILTILGETKALAGAGDLSSVFRQGGQLTWAHPILFSKNLIRTINLMRREDLAQQAMEEIRKRPNWKYYEKAGIDFPDWGVYSSNPDDRFVLKYYSKITNNRFTRGLINGSERAFVMYLNLMRADVFDAMVAGSTFGDASKMNDSQLRALGRFLNIGTQRADFDSRSEFDKAVSSAIPFANKFLWSPRNIWSRLQFIKETASLIGSYAGIGTNPYGDKTMRRLFAKELIRYMGGVAAGIIFVKFLADLMRDDGEPPEDVVLDPRSSDFLKVKIGNSHLDFLSGLSQILIFSSRMASGQTKTARGELKDANRGELMGRFLRSKFSPGMAIIYDNFTRENFDKQDIVLSNPVKKDKDEIGVVRHFVSQVVPLTGRDIVEQADQNGFPRAIVTWIASIVGIGCNTYDPNTYKQLSGDYRFFRKQWLAADEVERKRLEEYHPMLKNGGKIESQIKRVNQIKSAIKQREKAGLDVSELQIMLEDEKKKTVNAILNLKNPDEIR